MTVFALAPTTRLPGASYQLAVLLYERGIQSQELVDAPGRRVAGAKGKHPRCPGYLPWVHSSRGVTRRDDERSRSGTDTPGRHQRQSERPIVHVRRHTARSGECFLEARNLRQRNRMVLRAS